LVLTLGLLVLAALVLLAAWVAGQPVPAAAAGPPPDPYRHEVERFRRQVADWDGAR
jgi:hypothetical protein